VVIATLAIALCYLLFESSADDEAAIAVRQSDRANN